MEISGDALPGKWQFLKGKLRQRWGFITNDDIARMNGTTEELIAVLQRRYGFDRPRAEKAISDWLRENDEASPKK